MRMLINPGTFDCDGATEENARNNINALIADTGLSGVEVRREISEDYGNGRFCFILTLGSRECEVQMPGWELDKVRPTESIRGFSRLYVDGSSWFWEIAVYFVKSRLSGQDE